MSEYHPIPARKTFKDMTNKVIGRWTVLGYVGRKSGSSAWECRCECRAIKIVLGNSLRCGTSTGCRCYLTTHGCSVETTPEYRAWSAMKSRCNGSDKKCFSRYGGRGIKVCERWNSFKNFLADMGPRPDGTSLDRFPNNNGNYEPGNCRWATIFEQNRNKRNNRMVTLNGVTLCVSEWAERTGINAATLTSRLNSGKSEREALTRT